MIKLKDIAEEAGVALSTVSATLNGTGRVSAERRAEITALADKMGYRPNLAAKLLRDSENKILGLVVVAPPQTLPGHGVYSAVIAEMVEDCCSQGWRPHFEMFDPENSAQADVLPSMFTDGLAAMILGIELAARIGVAEHSRRRGQGFLPSSLAGSFGAVITAACLLGLSREQIVHALGINYAQISGNRQALLDASLTKRLQPAFAVRSALWAVDLARTGITGPRQSEFPRLSCRDSRRNRRGRCRDQLHLQPRMKKRTTQ